MDVVERLPRSLRRALAVLAGAALFGVGVALADSAATSGESPKFVGRLSLAPGASVSIQSRPLNQFLNGSGEWKLVAGPFPTSGSGTFNYGTTPAVGAEYEAVAAAGQLLSKPIKVVVAPFIGVSAPRTVTAGRPFTIRATVRPARAVSAIDLETYVPRLKQWHPLAHVRPTRAGRAAVKVTLNPGKSLIRASVSARELAAPGFGSASSK